MILSQYQCDVCGICSELGTDVVAGGWSNVDVHNYALRGERSAWVLNLCANCWAEMKAKYLP